MENIINNINENQDNLYIYQSKLDNYGFILTRHVNSHLTNYYWNESVRLLNKFYPSTKIIIIDDASDEKYIFAFENYKNITIIKSEYPRRGELLPYIYFLKTKYFDNAVILHDSVFIQKYINFDYFKNFKVLPLWHFEADRENINNSRYLISFLNNNYKLYNKFNNNYINTLGLLQNKYYGCFGCQAWINHDFLKSLNNKYQLINLIHCIRKRIDRCCLERILGCIFCIEVDKLKYQRSIFGNIMNYYKWELNYKQYLALKNNNKISKPIIKVWTGR